MNLARLHDRVFAIRKSPPKWDALYHHRYEIFAVGDNDAEYAGSVTYYEGETWGAFDVEQGYLGAVSSIGQAVGNVVGAYIDRRIRQ